MQGKLRGTEFQGTGFLLPVKSTVTVQVIPKDRMAKRGKMRPDLMGSSGNQVNPQAGNGAAFKRGPEC